MKAERRATAHPSGVVTGNLLWTESASLRRREGSIARRIWPIPGEQVSGVGLRMSQMDRGDVVGMPLAGRNAASCRGVSS